jgi:hypothetical protein
MSQARTTEILELGHEGNFTKGLRVINTDHAYIHAGIGFKGHLDLGNIAAAQSESYSFKTPAGKYIHLKNLVLAASAASVKLELFRGTVAAPLTINSPGGAATEWTGPHNANDNSATTSGVTVAKTPTYTAAQTGALWDFIIVSGAATNQFQSISEVRMSDNFELVLKPNTYYVLKFTNLSGADAAVDVNLGLFFYEEGAG